MKFHNPDRNPRQPLATPGRAWLVASACPWDLFLQWSTSGWRGQREPGLSRAHWWLFPGWFCAGWLSAPGHVQKDKQLTISGPYAYTRNPLYLGSLMLAGGFAIAARSWWIVAVMLLMFAVVYVPVIAGEETYLRQTFPEYDDYARHVPRMLPRLTPYGSRQSAYSSARYWKHREYEASIGCAVVLAVLIVKLLW